MEVGDGEGHGVPIDGGFGDFPFAFVVVLRTVVFGAFEVPGFDGEVFGFHRGGIDGVGERESDSGFGGVDLGGKVGGVVGFANAVEATCFSLAAGPGEHAAAVELAVSGVEATAHDPGGELLEREFAKSSLPLFADRLVRDDVDFSVAVTEVEELAVEGSPLGILGNPEEFGGRAVEAVGDPAEGILHRGVGGVGDG